MNDGATSGRAASRYRSLRRWNLAAASLHLLQGVVVVAFASDFALPVTTAFVRLDPATNALEPELDTLFELPLAPLIASFLFLSAAAHLTISLPGVYGWYRANLERGVNYARWLEYSLSASVMIVAVAMLVGIYDVVSLISLFAMNAAMILFGWVMERHNQSTDRTDWTAFLFGCIAGAVPWVAIAIYLAGAGSGDGDVPTFVYWIFGSIFVVFNIFAVNMFLQYRRLGPWKDYLFGEYSYIILSLTAKSLLAWQVFAGTLQPN